jgi:hypothetical protein
MFAQQAPCSAPLARLPARTRSRCAAACAAARHAAVPLRAAGPPPLRVRRAGRSRVAQPPRAAGDDDEGACRSLQQRRFIRLALFLRPCALYAAASP